MPIQESGEMYLETILLLSKKMQYVRSLDIATDLGFSKPSVSRAVGLLKKAELINVDSKGYITLTDEGVKIAKIAKVREKLSDGAQEFESIEDAEENISGESQEIEE